MSKKKKTNNTETAPTPRMTGFTPTIENHAIPSSQRVGRSVVLKQLQALPVADAGDESDQCYTLPKKQANYWRIVAKKNAITVTIRNKKLVTGLESDAELVCLWRTS